MVTDLVIRELTKPPPRRRQERCKVAYLAFRSRSRPIRGVKMRNRQICNVPAAGAVLQLCGRELLTKKCPFFSKLHISLIVERLVLILQTKQLEGNENGLQKCVRFPDDALNVVVLV